jgi:hypothetical protein
MFKHGYALVGAGSGLDLIWGTKDVFGCYDIPSFESYMCALDET